MNPGGSGKLVCLAPKAQKTKEDRLLSSARPVPQGATPCI